MNDALPYRRRLGGNRPLHAVLAEVLNEYPRLRPLGLATVDSRHLGMGDARQLEFYPPEEGDNPIPGRPTVEVFNPKLRGDDLRNAIFGDALHYLPTVDPRWRDWKQEYVASRTPEQIRIDENAYARAQQEYGEDRPLEQWLDTSRTDQAMGGYMAPVNGGWQGYTPEQVALFERMLNYLRGGATQ